MRSEETRVSWSSCGAIFLVSWTRRCASPGTAITCAATNALRNSAVTMRHAREESGDTVPGHGVSSMQSLARPLLYLEGLPRRAQTGIERCDTLTWTMAADIKTTVMRLLSKCRLMAGRGETILWPRQNGGGHRRATSAWVPLWATIRTYCARR
jgi:hypothetical protein